MRLQLTNEIYQLGEGPIWDHRLKRLYYIDIESHLLCYLDFPSKQPTTINLPKAPGTVILGHDSHLLYLLLADGLYEFNLTTETLTFISAPKNHTEDYRFNDGKCGPDGHIYVGSMHKTNSSNEPGMLYHIDEKGVFHEIDPYYIPNGMVWDTKNGYYYCIDSVKQQVYRYLYNDGIKGIKEPWIDFKNEQTFPDGMTSDCEGFLYIANWHGSKITKWNPLTKEKTATYPLDAYNVTSCVFGYESLDHLIITSASIDTPEDREEKNSGSLFVLPLNIKGSPSYLYTFK